jgi:hypothetical protein
LAGKPSYAIDALWQAMSCAAIIPSNSSRGATQIRASTIA